MTRERRGLTMMDLFLVVLCIAVLGGLWMRHTARKRRPRRLSNLSCIGRGMAMYLRMYGGKPVGRPPFFGLDGPLYWPGFDRQGQEVTWHGDSAD